MTDLVIEIDCTGKTSALHMDGFDLGFLGDKAIHRQSDILFNAATQKWNIRYLLADGSSVSSDSLSGFSSYEEARHFEVKWLNDCRLTGDAPDGINGMSIAEMLREVHTWSAEAASN